MLPPIQANSILVSNSAGDAREEKTFQEVSQTLSFTAWDSRKTRTMRERSRYIVHLDDFITDMNGVNDETVAVQAWLDQAGIVGRAMAGRGVVLASDTLYVPAGVVVQGSGRKDYWKDGSGWSVSNPLGTVFRTTGSGTARRWTDVDGADLANDTPLFVARGNNVVFEDLTVYTDGANAWSMGILIPCVKQCALNRVSGFGFTDGTLYIDATWSNRNTVLKALHPSIDPDTGMNEFSADDCWFEGGGSAGFGLKIQGTTRAWNTLPQETWMWAAGGTSDIRISKTRLGSNAPNGGCYSHDAQLAGETAFGRGITMDGVGFRASGGSKYAIRLDRSDGHHFISPYAEGKSGVPWEIAITSRTQTAPQGILFEGERMISGNVTVDGVVVSSTSRRFWKDTRCLSYIRQRGELSLPNFGGGRAATFEDIPYISSFESNGTIFFKHDDGSAQINIARLNTSLFRPEADGAMTLGDAARNWGAVFSKRYQSGTVTVSDDSAVSIPTPKSGGIMAIVHCGGVEDGAFPNIFHSGLACYDTGSSVTCGKWAGGTNFATATGDVTGTTGVDGQTTIGVRAGNVRVENRSGATSVYRYTLLS